MPRYALLIAYHGGGFAGWAAQDGRRSVAGEIDAALARLGEAAARVQGAARTDAGVHALAQAAHVDLVRDWEALRLAQALGGQLPPDCACRAAARVADAWDAVAAASGKTYRYRIDNGAVADPFLADRAWRPPFRLDLAALRAAASGLAGSHDWSAFRRSGETRADLVRSIAAVDWDEEAGGVLVCSVRGSGFAYRLVRSLVGAMVAVAHGSCPPGDLLAAVAGEANGAARQQAPAQGLRLEELRLEPEPDWSAPA